MASVIEISNRHILFIFSRAVSNLRYRDPRASFGLGNDSEASKGGMRVGRIKDPLYKDSQMGLGHLQYRHPTFGAFRNDVGVTANRGP